MDVKLLSKTEEKMSFLLKDSTPIIANTLRRYIVEHVPTLAIEEVEFKKNNSLLYDTMIAHRLGLIPIKTDLKSYNLPKIVSGKEIRDATSQVEFSLESSSVGMVYSGKLKFKDPAVKPMSDNFPIVKLLKGQNIQCSGQAVMGRGIDHAKWSTAHVWYTYEPEITINNDSPKLEEFKEKYPRIIFDEKGRIDKNKINTPQLIDAVAGVCDTIIKVAYNPNNFVFYVESFGQLDSKEIVLTALSIFDAQLDNFLDALNAAS